MESSLGDLGRFENIWEFPIEDFAVLARPDVQGLYILNPSARFIFENLRAGVSLEPLVDQFASTFDISRELATRDITQTLTGWRSDLLSAPRPSSSQRSAAALPPVSPQSDFFVHTYLIHGKSVRIGLQTSDLADEIAPRLTVNSPLAIRSRFYLPGNRGSGWLFYFLRPTPDLERTIRNRGAQRPAAGDRAKLARARRSSGISCRRLWIEFALCDVSGGNTIGEKYAGRGAHAKGIDPLCR